MYDDTGSLDDDTINEQDVEGLYQFYKRQFNEVTEKGIEDFKKKYKNSSEEHDDVLKYYAMFEGDMKQVFDHVMLSELDEDGPRFAEMCEQGIKEGVIERYTVFDTWKIGLEDKIRKNTGKKKKTKKNAVKRNAATTSDHCDLEKAILARQAERQPGHGAFVSFAAKYGVSMEDGPSEEEFEKARKRLKRPGRG